MAKRIQFEYDVFVSYSHRNIKWVHGVLLPHLEDADLKVFLDSRDFQIGAASIREMERGVTTSRKILVVLTPEYLKSGWTEFEILMTQTLSPANRDLRVIPVLKKDCSLPPSIGYMNYINLANPKDKEFEWKRLIVALGGQQQFIPRVLVVDDQLDVQNTIGGLLRDTGYKVYTASDEDSAYTILRQEHIDYVIVDIRLHESDDDESGLKLANAIHSLASHVQMIILSGSTLPKHIIRAFKDLGVVDYIIKTPDMGDQLLKTIKELSTKSTVK